MKKKIIILSVSMTIVVLLVLKLIVGINLVNISREIVFSTYENYGVLPDEYSGVISEELFEIIGFRHKPVDEEIDEVCGIENFFVAAGFTKAIVTYEYTYFPTDKETGKSFGGSLEIPCAIYFEFSDGKWIVVDYYEAP